METIIIGVLLAGVVTGIIAEFIYSRATNNFEQDFAELKRQYQEELDSYDRCLEAANEEIDKRQAELDEANEILYTTLEILKEIKPLLNK